MLHDDKAPWRYESEVVWLKPGYYSYLREVVVTRTHRAGEIRMSPFYKVVAYAKLKPDAPNIGVKRRFDRRIWYLNRIDKLSVRPCEAVDPHTISAGGRSARDCLLRDWLTWHKERKEQD